MRALKIILAVIINGILFLPITVELVSTLIDDLKKKKKEDKEIRQANLEYIERYGKKKRKICLDCSYCKWKYYHPFSKYGQHYWYMVSKEPIYCKKFKIKLPSKGYELRCQAKRHDQAMYEVSSN